jgi:hypothetical protein
LIDVSSSIRTHGTFSSRSLPVKKKGRKKRKRKKKGKKAVRKRGKGK